MKKEESVLVLFCLNMKSMKGRCRLVTSFLVRTPPSFHAARATAWESYSCLHLGKQVSHMEPASASYDGLDLPWVEPFRFERKSDGSFYPYCAHAFSNGPFAT